MNEAFTKVLVEKLESAEKGILKMLADEWGKLSEQALAVQNRKRELREILEPLFESIIPKLNQELKEARRGYLFRGDQNAGYTPTGPISFELYALATKEWQTNDMHDGVVDYDRAEELTEFVNKSKSVSEFKALFPHIQITVTANYIGFFRLDEENQAVEDLYGYFGEPDES